MVQAQYYSAHDLFWGGFGVMSGVVLLEAMNAWPAARRTRLPFSLSGQPGYAVDHNPTRKRGTDLRQHGSAISRSLAYASGYDCTEQTDQASLATSEPFAISPKVPRSQEEPNAIRHSYLYVGALRPFV
jgi:hypothetical protein